MPASSGEEREKSEAFSILVLELIYMEVEPPLFVQESSLPRGHAIRFQVSSRECMGICVFVDSKHIYQTCNVMP